MQFTNLIQFRQAAYRCLGRARDAQFELTDAVPHCPYSEAMDGQISTQIA